MNDVGHGTLGTKTHRISIKNEDMTMNNDVGNKMIFTTAVIDTPLFSSPQNRRASMVRFSQKSHNSSLPLLGQSMRSATDNGPNINGSICTGGPRDSTTRDAVVADVDDSFDVLRAADHSARDSRKAILNSRKSADRVQEVLGVLPILLVDDSVPILKMTKRAILNECTNISFIEAKNGEEAFERVVEAVASFEMIITDIQMPICNGFDFTRRVRQLEREKGLRPKLIIGISANDQQKISIEAKESGMIIILLDTLSNTRY